MSDLLARVQILLDANTARFEQAMENAQDTSKTTFQKISDGAKMMGAAVAAGAVAGGAALITYTQEHMAMVQDLQKFAFLADTTTQDFQKMAVAAGAYGIEQDQLAGMMKDFNEKLGELTSVGGGGGIDFFEKIATKTEGGAEGAKKLILEMQRLSGPEALQLYVDKLEEAGVAQEQMSFYLEGVAGDLTELIPLLVNNGEGMKLYADAAERAGIILNDKTIASSAVLTEQMYLLDLQMQGAKNQLMQAVIPAFLDISEAFFGGSEQGLQFTGVAEGIANGLKVVASIAIGAVTAIQLVGKALGGMAAIGGAIYNQLDWYEMNPIGFAKAAYEARTEITALSTEIKGDMNETIMGAASRLDKIWAGEASSTAEKMAELKKNKKELEGVNGGLLELGDDAAASAKNQADALKLQKDAQDALNKALAEAKKLVYDYGTEFARIDHDLTNELAVIRGSILKPSDKNMMIAEAKSISQARKKIYLLEYEADLDSWKWTEESKLAKTLELEIAKITATKGMRQDERNLRIQSQKDIHAHEMAWLQLESAQRLDDAQKAFHTEMQIMTSYYEFERAQIRLNKSLSEEDREVFINASIKTQDLDVDEQRRSAWNNFQNASGFDTSADDERERRNQAFQDALDWQLITQDEYQQQMLRSEAIYNQTRMDMALDVTGSTVSTWADAFGAILGEQSTAYKAMIIADRAIAITRALLNVPEAYSEAFNAVVGTPYIGPYIAPVIGGAAAAAQVAQVALVKGVDVQGIFHGGEDYVPKEASYFLDEGERVLSPRQNTDLTNYLDNQNSRGSDMPNLTINIMTLPGTTAKAEMSADGELNIEMIRKEMDEYIPYQLSKANSPISQAFSVNYATQRNR